jgi:segregation and condensation protein A
VSHVVQIEGFEGPIDLLLHLISIHDMDILEVPLAPIIDGFVAVLSANPESLSMDVLSEFLLVAAILLELKSQRLLPGPDGIDEDEELGGWDQRDLLVARLLECQAYAAASDVFLALLHRAARSFPRDAGFDEGFVVRAPDLLAGVTPLDLAGAYLRATAERPEPRVDLSHVTVDTVTVAEAVADLVIELPALAPISFRDLTRHLSTRIEIIVRFLALLELCKLGKVTLGQGSTFGDLQVAWRPEERTLSAVSANLIDDYDG